MKAYVSVLVFEYLKSPKYKWTFNNAEGGSFSNSGEFRSLKACGAHCLNMLRSIPGVYDLPVVVTTIHGFDEYDKEVATKSETYLNRIL
jgi:hypothetical protein